MPFDQMIPGRRRDRRAHHAPDQALRQPLHRRVPDREIALPLLRQGQVDFIAEADYREGSRLSGYVELTLRA